MIMRDTVFCMIGADADRTAITRSIHEMVAEVQQYVPGYTLRAEPQFDDPRESWDGNGRVAVFLEVKGNGDYLPDVRRQPRHHDRRGRPVGELMAQAKLGDVPHDPAGTDARRPDHRHHAARRQPRDGPPVHRDAGARHRARAGPGRASRSSRSPTATASAARSFNYGFSHTDEMTLIAAAREEARQARIAVLLVPGIGTVDDLRRARDAGADDGAGGHPLHRGRRLAAALRAGARPGHGDRRVPDDGPPDFARRTWRSRPGSWSTPAARPRTSPTRRARCSCTRRRRASRRWSPRWATRRGSATTATRTCPSAWPTR